MCTILYVRGRVAVRSIVPAPRTPRRVRPRRNAAVKTRARAPTTAPCLLPDLIHKSIHRLNLMPVEISIKVLLETGAYSYIYLHSHKVGDKLI